MGGAAGDALGYAVEFEGEGDIFGTYGERGITEYELTDGIAMISDDTQMTLFTAEGLLLAAKELGEGESGDGAMADPADTYVAWIDRAYRDWLKTQSLYHPKGLKYEDTCTRLMDLPEIFDRRAPGTTCLNALGSSEHGTIEDPINDRKGCGGVMRVAPIGLFFAGDEGGADLGMIAARAAAITHGHEMGYIPAATLTQTISKIIYEDATIEEAVASALEATEAMFKNARSLPSYLELMNRAVFLSRKDVKDLDAIHDLGEGWVGDEALAIAVYCALRYPDDIDRALIAAVNHKGDSDSTGAIAGNIIGASVGLSGIPDKYKEDLELYDTIVEYADELYGASRTRALL